MHPTTRISTHPFTYDRVFSEPKTEKEFNSHELTIIGNDVWIGAGAIILPGLKIGDGAIIGANTTVTKNIPPYAIAVGNPAKVIKYRFDKQMISTLLELKWWELDDKIINNLPFYDNILFIKELQRLKNDKYTNIFSK